LRLLFRNPGSVRIGFGLLALIFFLLAFEVKAQPTPQSPVPLPVPFNPIVDNANVIDAETRQRLESIYLNLKERANIEYAVVTVNTTGGIDIFDFSLAIARGWGIGSKEGDKAAFLLVVAIQDRKYFTQVSRHLEGDLPDGLVGQIQRERLLPAFRQGNYSKGIFDTIQAVLATLGSKRGFTVEGIDQRYAYRETPRQPSQPESNRNALGSICTTIFVIVIIVVFLSLMSRRGGRGGGSGCLQALFWGSLFSNLNSGGSRGGSSSGWGGGGFGGGGFGGGGGGFGGGFGGGGDFGGGGAGGSW
jgi:uncharacterized protein